MSRYLGVEREAALVDLGGSGRGNPGLTAILLAPIAKHQPVIFDPGVELPLLGECIFYLEEIGEVAAGLDAHLQITRLGTVVENREVFMKPVTHCPAAHYR